MCVCASVCFPWIAFFDVFLLISKQFLLKRSTVLCVDVCCVCAPCRHFQSIHQTPTKDPGGVPDCNNRMRRQAACRFSRESPGSSCRRTHLQGTDRQGGKGDCQLLFLWRNLILLTTHIIYIKKVTCIKYVFFIFLYKPVIFFPSLKGSHRDHRRGRVGSLAALLAAAHRFRLCRPRPVASLAPHLLWVRHSNEEKLFFYS